MTHPTYDRPDEKLAYSIQEWNGDETNPKFVDVDGKIECETEEEGYALMTDLINTSMHSFECALYRMCIFTVSKVGRGEMNDYELISQRKFVIRKALVIL